MEFKLKYEGPWADLDKPLILPTSTWRTEIPVTKARKCCQCGWCYIFCPCGCVVDRGVFFSADLDFCKGCGVCAWICPVNAITMVREG